MTVRDRGTKKWTSLFMPEHVEELRKFYNVEYHRQEKPTLDEGQIEEMERVIAESMETGSALRFSVWEDGFTREVTGRVHFVDVLRKELRVMTQNNSVERVKFDTLVTIVLL